MPDPVTIYLTGDPLLAPPFFFTVPANFNPLNNVIEMIGGGGQGTIHGGGGAAGGHWAKSVNVPLVPNAVVPYKLKSRENGAFGVHGDIDTQLGSDDAPYMRAKAGPSATGTGGAVSPDASESIGDTVHIGGNGGDGAGGNRGGGGGGSPGSPTGNGKNGGDADPSGYGGGGGASPTEAGANGSGNTGGAGGGGDTLGGNGGTFGPSRGRVGDDGQSGSDDPYGTEPWGFGGAGGGASGDPEFPGDEGGRAGDFGAGAGGSSGNAYIGFVFGSRGIIKITYVPTFTPPGQGEIVPPALRRAENVEAVHLLEVDAAIVGTYDGSGVTPSLTYAYGYGSAPFDAISLQSVIAVDRRTFIYSDRGYRSPVDDPGGERISLPRLVTTPSISRVLNLSFDQVAAGFSWGNGALARVNDDYNFDGTNFLGINYYSTDGAPVRMYLGLKTYDPVRGLYVDPAFNDMLPIFTGVAQQWRIARDTIQVPVRDAMYLLDAPLQRLAYSGSGGLGGDASITGLPIPKTRGGTTAYPVRNVKPVLVDATHLIYQYNDAAGTIVALYEGAAAVFTYQGDVADLYSGTTEPGKYRTDNARGLFQLGTNAAADITCDVTGEFPRNGAVTKPAEIARHLIDEDLGISTDMIDFSAFSLAEAQYNYVSGAYFAPDSNISGVQAVAFMLGSIGAKIGTSKSGKLRPYVVRGYSYPAAAIYLSRDIQDIRDAGIPDGVSPVVSRLRVRFAKNWTVQSSGYLGEATAAQKQFAASAGPVASWQNSINAIKYPSAKDPDVIDTALLVEADAQAVADALGDFWGTPRRAFQLDLPLYAIERDIADNIRFDEDIGIRPYPFYCFVYGISYSPGAAFCTLSVVA